MPFVPRHFISPLFRNAAFVRRASSSLERTFLCGRLLYARAQTHGRSLAFRRRKVTLSNLFRLFTKNTCTDISQLTRGALSRIASHRSLSESRETVHVSFFPLFAAPSVVYREYSPVPRTELDRRRIPQSLAAIDRPHVKSGLDTPRRIRAANDDTGRGIPGPRIVL